jgi:superfamily II DNA or RNA helicase
MLDRSRLHPYQERAIQMILDRGRVALWLDMSLGKSIIALTAIVELIDMGVLRRALVVAPVRVAEAVWRQEAAKWAHTRHLRIELLRGKQADKVMALHRSDADIHVVNYEALPWLIKQVNKDFFSRGKPMPWNGLILDEIDRLKDASGQRYAYLEKILPGMHLRVGLTGTPASNGYYDLHGQYRMLDDGKRLHYDIGTFRDAKDVQARAGVIAAEDCALARAKVAEGKEAKGEEKTVAGDVVEGDEWTMEEQVAFEASIRAANDSGLDGKLKWRAVASAVPGRTPKECLARFKAIAASLRGVQKQGGTDASQQRDD